MHLHPRRFPISSFLQLNLAPHLIYIFQIFFFQTSKRILVFSLRLRYNFCLTSINIFLVAQALRFFFHLVCLFFMARHLHN